MIRVVRSAQPQQMFRAFRSIIGEERMKASYRGLDSFPVKTERVWEVQEDQEIIAWGSLIQEPLGTTFLLRAGVWPQATKRRLRVTLSRRLFTIAFLDAYTIAVNTATLLTNPEQCRRLKSETDHWEFAGVIVAPSPGYMAFTMTRARFEAQQVTWGPDDILPEVS